MNTKREKEREQLFKLTDQFVQFVNDRKMKRYLCVADEERFINNSLVKAMLQASCPKSDQKKNFR